MNPLLLAFIGIPALEIFFMIKIGGQIGAFNTILLIFLTAIIGVYFAKLEGLKTLRSGIIKSYQNRLPLFEMLSGASIAIAAMFLIIPGFFSDALGFLLLIPITRKILIKYLFKVNNNLKKENVSKTLDGEIIEKKKDEL
tara:strand:- start:587 stop:1006 length:420 start_codon:yes stop_codon:yes gene_type:complete